MKPGETFTITIGRGGSAAQQATYNTMAGNTDGGASSFGNLLVAAGGKTPQGLFIGGNGGSGGGASCVNTTDYSYPGSDGGPGGWCLSNSGGSGQGSFQVKFAIFKRVNGVQYVSIGGYGSLGTNSEAFQFRCGGGGGGGVCINSVCSSAERLPYLNSKLNRPTGGYGFGAGGGAGGYFSTIHYAGGSGASGVVLIQWD